MKARDLMVLVTTLAAVLAAPIGPAAAQTLDHLKCYQVKDPVKLKGPKPSWLDLTGVDGSTEQCRIVGGFRLACMPVRKDVTAAIQRKLDGPFEDFVPAPSNGRAAGDKLCYKIRCNEPGPADRDLTDQFGSRTVSKLKPFLLCGPIECDDGTISCEGGCVDTQIDPDNCGGCGNACADGMWCSAGVCECPAGQTDCDGACVDTRIDLNHCGSCGNSCGGLCVENSHRSCDGGVCLGCVCDEGFEDCGEAGGCVDLQTDVAHCGSCGNACGGTCDAGGCECPVGRTNCDGTCADTQTDLAHCGSCGNACAAGAFCVSGTCLFP